MKRLAFMLSLFLAGASAAVAQTQADIPGDWSVLKVSISDKAGEIAPDVLKKIETSFLQTSFRFKADGQVIVDSPQKVLQFKKSQWTFNEQEKSISVNGTDMAGKEGLLLKMFVKLQDTKWTFGLSDAPITLEVKKGQ
jgi:hypothetical protein